MQKMLIFFLLSLLLNNVLADDTLLKFYRPFGEVYEQVAPVATKQLKGRCFGPSQLIVREDAWHCEAENKVYDPCFVKTFANQTEVLCPESPWSSESVQLHLENALNSEGHPSLDMSRTLPWAVELTSGAHCQLVPTTEKYEAMPIHYRCDNQNQLLGYLQRCKAVWSMLEKTPTGIVTAEFKKAWF